MIVRCSRDPVVVDANSCQVDSMDGNYYKLFLSPDFPTTYGGTITGLFFSFFIYYSFNFESILNISIILINQTYSTIIFITFILFNIVLS